MGQTPCLVKLANFCFSFNSICKQSLCPICEFIGKGGFSKQFTIGDAKKLTDEQIGKLNNIRYKDCQVVRKVDGITWERQFDALEQAKKMHGHLRYLNEGSSSWITRQRQAFADGTLDPLRKERLERLGVCLFIDNSKRNRSRITPSKQAKWMAKLQKYQNYVAENGHGNVPRRYKLDGLGDWVQQQRKSYVELKDSRDPILAERFRKLNEIKFPWRHPSARARRM